MSALFKALFQYIRKRKKGDGERERDEESER